MSGGRLVLIGGGVRSGKSRFALERARALGASDSRRVFVATAQAFDDEMKSRIAAHRAERRDSEFFTVEEPLELAERIASFSRPGPETCGAGDVVLVDCLTLWMSNVLLAQEASSRELEERATAASKALVVAASAAAFDLVLVTNEVGMGLVPDNALGRLFRDCAGRLHQLLAAEADEVYLATLGCLLRLRPGPVELVP